MLEYIDQFITYLCVERNYSPLTCEAYKRDLKKFSHFLLTRNITSWDGLGPDDLRSFLVQQANRGLAASTRNRTLAAIQSFYRFLKYDGVCRLDWVLDVPSAKVPHKIPNCLNFADFKAIIAQIPHSSYYDLRDRCLLELLFGSGLRISEAINLELHQLYDDHVRVIGKGNKERVVPITKHFVRAFRRFWKVRSPEITSPRDKVFGLDRISAWRAVKKRVKAAGITKRISPHTFRHGFATELLKGGADIRIVQDMLGHESIESTSIYLHLTDQQLRDKFERFHPRP